MFLDIHPVSRSTNLICEVATLHSQISTDVFVDRPCEFIIKLPCNHHHEDRTHRHDAWNDDQERLGFSPNILIDSRIVGQNGDSLLHLLNLHCPVDQESDVTKA